MKRKKLGYVGQQLLGYSIVLVLIAVILFTLLHLYMTRLSLANMKGMQNQVTNSATEHVNNYFDQLMLIGSQVAQDEDVIEIMSQLQTEEVNNPETNWFWKRGRRKISSRLYWLLGSHNFAADPAWRISVYNDLGDFMSSGAGTEDEFITTNLAKDSDLSRILQNSFLDGNARFKITGPIEDPFSDHEGPYISLIQPIYDTEGSLIGYVDVQKSAQPLYDLLELDNQTGLNAYLFTETRSDGKQWQVYPPDDGYPPSDDVLHLQTGITEYDWEVRVVIDQELLYQPYRLIMLTVFVTATFLFLLMFIGIILVTRNTSRPILLLSDRIRKATLDNSGHEVIGPATDEVKALEQSFDIMLQRMKTSVELEKKAYLKALQSQMNPHFLYNSLFAISSMAMDLDDHTIPKFCDHLAAILRYETTSGDNLVTLREETMYIHDYLELMKLRFEEDFDYTMEVDDALIGLPMPRLTLQPILENCFEHAFTEVPPPWHIDLKIFRQENRWVIRVADNGSGFRPEHQLRLEHQIKAMSQEHVTQNDLNAGGLGLANTIVRLRLALDESIEYTIDPKMPTGTIVTLKGSMTP